MPRIRLLEEIPGLKEYLRQPHAGDAETSRTFAERIVNRPWFEEHVKKELKLYGITHPKALNHAKDHAILLLVPDLTTNKAIHLPAFSEDARYEAIKAARTAVNEGKIPSRSNRLKYKKSHGLANMTPAQLFEYAEKLAASAPKKENGTRRPLTEEEAAFRKTLLDGYAQTGWYDWTGAGEIHEFDNKKISQLRRDIMRHDPLPKASRHKAYQKKEWIRQADHHHPWFKEQVKNAHGLAWQYIKKNPDLQPSMLVNESEAGLLHAIGTYDPKKGKKLGGWVYLKVRGYLLDAIEREKQKVKTEHFEEGIKLDKPATTADDKPEVKKKVTEAGRLLLSLHRAGTLSETHLLVFLLKNFHKTPNEHISTLLGLDVTKARITQLKNEAAKIIRQAATKEKTGQGTP